MKAKIIKSRKILILMIKIAERIVFFDFYFILYNTIYFRNKLIFSNLIFYIRLNILFFYFLNY
jgi:hypothetical protein